MRELPVDFEELADAMEDHTGETQWLLDLETGELYFISSEVAELAYQEEPDLSTLDDWEQEPAQAFLAAQEGDPRYKRVPQVQSYEVYNVMVEFAESVRDRRLAGMLELALDGKGAFGRFNRVLAGYPREAERWYAMKQAWLEEQIREWLHDLEIEPIRKPPES